jgi:hypothetical protein
MEERPYGKPLYAILLFAAVAFIAFFPCLVLNQVYFANDLLQSHSHFRSFLRSQLLSGHFPLWDPDLCGGVPFFGDPDAMMCYPINYLTLIFPVPYGLGFFFFLHMFLAATGAYLWLRALKLSETPCRLGALTYALSAFFWWELIHPPILAALAMFPWVLACLERLAKDLRPRWAFLSGLSFALVLSCGSFQMTTCVFYATLAYFLFRLFTRQGPEDPFPWKKIGEALLFVLWGGLPLLALFIPAFELSRQSNRESAHLAYEQYNGTYSMMPKTVYEFLFPALGVPEASSLESAIQGGTDSQGNVGNDFLGAFGYLGVWVPFLFFLAFQRKDKKLLYFLLGLGLLSILAGWGMYFPLHRLACSLVPGIKQFRAPFRFTLVYVLLGSALLAFGYQTVERWLSEKNRSPALALGAGFYGLFFLVIAFINPSKPLPQWTALVLGAAGLLLWSLTESWKPLGRVFFLAALTAPLLLSGWSGYSRGPASVYDYETNFPALSYLKENRTGGRYFFGNDLLYPVTLNGRLTAQYFPPDLPMEFNLRSYSGYVSLFLEKYLRLQTLPFPTFLRLMAVKGFLFRDEKESLKNLPQKEFPYCRLYEVPPPSTYITGTAKVACFAGDEKTLEAMKSPDFDPSATTYFSELLPPPVASQLSGSKSQISWEVLQDQANTQIFKLHLSQNSMVTFSEVMYPGWKAWVDGSPALLYTGNYMFRSVFVPGGDHQVEFRYEPSWLHPLLLLATLWFLSALAYFLFLLKNRKTPALAAP